MCVCVCEADVLDVEELQIAASLSRDCPAA